MKKNSTNSAKFSAPRLAKVFACGALALGTVFATSTVQAKKVEYRKSQNVDFDAVDIDGKTNTPDGAYLTQKRGIDFLPLYKVRKNFDDSIKESALYVK